MATNPPEKKIGCGFLALFFGICILGPLGFIWTLNRLAPEVVEKEIARVTSPDGSLDLVIASADAGATTSTAYFVGVAQKGRDPDEAGLALTVDHLMKANDLMAAWRGEKLVIEVHSGRIFKNKTSVQVGSRKVDVVFK